MTTTRNTASRLRSSTYRLGPPIVVFLVVLGVWYAISLSLDPDRQFLLPTPNEVIDVGFVNQDNLFQVLEGLLWTLAVSMTGLVIAIVLGMTSAIMMSQAKWVETSFYPYAVIIQTVPILAIVPAGGPMAGIRVHQPGGGVRDHLHIPDHHQHPVRSPVGARLLSRPVHPAPVQAG